MSGDENNSAVLHSLDTRLTVIEADLDRLTNIRKWMLSFVGLFLIQFTGFIYGYAQLEQKVEGINLRELEKNVSVALTVVADHGTELESIRTEQARIRGQIDQFHLFMENMRKKLDAQTRDRWYKSDGDRLEGRVSRIEDRLFRQIPQRIGNGDE